MKIKINSIVRLYVVLLLSEKPRHGYELIEELKRRLNADVSPSQIYPFLSLLLKNDIIKVTKRGAREKKLYRVTGKGRKFISELMQHFGDLALLAIKPKLTVCSHCGCRVVDGGHREKIGEKIVMFCCRHCASHFKKP